MPWGSIGCFLGAALIMVFLACGADLVPLQSLFHGIISVHRIDDIVAALLLVVSGVVFAIVENRTRHQVEIQAQRLRVLKATMRTVHDIVNNHLNACQLFALEGEGALDAKTLADFEQLIQETAAKLKMLGDLETVPEKQLIIGPGIDYDPALTGGPV